MFLFFFGNLISLCERLKFSVFLSAGYAKLPFKWFDYLREMGSVAAPVKLFNKVRFILGFCALFLINQF